VVGQHDGFVLTDSPGRNRSIAGTQTREHLGLLGTCHQPDDAPRSIQHGIGQGHPAPALIESRERDVESVTSSTGSPGTSDAVWPSGPRPR